MEIAELLWLDAVVDKIESKHRVTPTEVEEILSNRPRIRKMNKGRFRGEDVYRALGQTRAGRYLTVFFIYKQTKEALILSVRDMDQKERRSYASK
jgi:uncharacterized DUF497 family protein